MGFERRGLGAGIDFGQCITLSDLAISNAFHLQLIVVLIGKDALRRSGPRRRPELASWTMGTERWLGESEQSDKWFPCLIAALMPRSRREHVETITAQP